MDSNWNPEPIKQLLNSMLARIDQPTLDNLRSARMHAVNRYEARSATLPLFAWASAPIIRDAHSHINRGYYWIGAMLLAACLYSSINFLHQAIEHDTSDEDIAILTDEMPIQYFID